MPSGRIRSMAGTDARLDAGAAEVVAAAALAVGADIREPLRSLYQNSPHDPGVPEHVKTFPVPSKLLQPPYRPFLSGSSKSSSSRSPSPDAEDASHLSEGGAAGGGVAREPGTEQRLRMSSNPRGSHTPTPEEHHEATPPVPSECSEIQNVDDTASSPMSMSEGSQSYCYSDSQLITDVEDNENLMQLKLEAMTWAAMAKDFTISSLEKRLRKALQIAKAEHAKNVELQTALDQSREEVLKAREDIVRLEEAEELLVRERGEVEVDAANFAVDQARHHRSQLLLLEHRIRLMLGDKAVRGQHDRYLEMFASPNSQGAWEESDVGILELEVEKSIDRERAVADKFLEGQQEIEELKRELNDASTDLRVSEVLRKAQSRRIKVLEKERRYLLRKGALRTVKLAPRTQRRVEPSMPGGPGGSGWNVFSVLEYAEA